MKKLHNKVAVITGGGSGIGLAAASLFKEEGAKVIINARNEERLKEVMALHPDAFDRAIKADVSRVSDIEHFYQQIHQEFGKIDVLFLNAGTGKLLPMEMIDEAVFDETIDVNYKGVFFGIQKALPFLKDGASVIITSSVTNVMADPLTTVYAGTKAAVISLAKTVSMALKERNIRVNSLSPGPVDTPIFSKAGVPDDQLASLKDMLKKKIPVGRIGNTSELAKAALFLASDDSLYMTGSEMVMDGGYSLQILQI